MPKHKEVIAAMSSTESDVEAPGRRRSSSFAAQVTDLQPGECASRATLIDSSHSLATIAENSKSWRDELRNNTTPAIKRAKERVGGEYTLEVGELMTFGHNLYIVAIVTRTA